MEMPILRPPPIATRHELPWVSLVLVVMFSGCTAQLQTAKTIAKVPLPDGRVFEYESGKEQQGIDALYTVEIDPATDKIVKKTMRLKVDKTGTPEAAYSALVEQQKAMTETQKAVTELIKAVIDRMPVPP